MRHANTLAPLAVLTSLMPHGCVFLQEYDIIEQEKAAYLASLSSNSSSCESSSSGLAGHSMGSSDSLSSDASLDEMEGLYCKGQQAALYARSASINAKVRSKRRAVRVICATCAACAFNASWWMMHCHGGCCRNSGGLDLLALCQCVSAQHCMLWVCSASKHVTCNLPLLLLPRPIHTHSQAEAAKAAALAARAAEVTCSSSYQPTTSADMAALRQQAQQLQAGQQAAALAAMDAFVQHAQGLRGKTTDELREEGNKECRVRTSCPAWCRNNITCVHEL